MIRVILVSVLMAGLLSSCGSDFKTPDVVLVDLGIDPRDPALPEDMNTSYHNSKPALPSLLPLVKNYSTDLPVGPPGYDATRPDSAIAYLDIDGDTFLDIYLSTGTNVTADAYFDNIFLNDTANNFSYDVTAFLDNSDPQVSNEPLSLHASKALVSDFNIAADPGTTGNWLDVFVLDQGAVGGAPKLILHKTRFTDPANETLPLIHWFTHQIYSLDAGYHTGGASADIDNDGDADVFVGGLEPFFYINNSLGGFTKVNNRWDKSMNKVLAAELVDIDMDGYVDLIAGANEADGDVTSIYWGNSTGTYNNDHRTLLASNAYGVILDFEVENLDADSNRDVVIYRNSAADTDRVIQILKNNGDRSFTETSSFTVAKGSAWLRAQDRGGLSAGIDIFPDNAAVTFWLDNNGTGVFTLR